MPYPRTAAKKGWPIGLYERADGYYYYRSPITRKSVSFGRVPLAQAKAAAKLLNERATKVKDDKHIAMLNRAHVICDERGLLEASQIISNATKHERVCGIYFLVRDGAIVYVGQSVSIHARLSCHSTDPSKSFDSFYFDPCKQEDLNRREAMYIDKFKPLFNRAMPTETLSGGVWSKGHDPVLGVAVRPPDVLLK